MKLGSIITICVIAAAMLFGAVAFKNSLVAYVPFSQAVQAAETGSTVQIMGVPEKGQTAFDQASGCLHFVLAEQGTSSVMPVVFKSPKPDNFDQAVKIAAIGHYDPAAKTFVADNLLVKCPSKYAGDTSGQTNRSYSAKA